MAARDLTVPDWRKPGATAAAGAHSSLFPRGQERYGAVLTTKRACHHRSFLLLKSATYQPVDTGAQISTVCSVSRYTGTRHQQIAFAVIAGQVGGAFELCLCFRMPAQLDQQVRAHRR